MENGFSHVLVILSQDCIFARGGLRSDIKREQNNSIWLGNLHTGFDYVWASSL